METSLDRHSNKDFKKKLTKFINLEIFLTRPKTNPDDLCYYFIKEYYSFLSKYINNLIKYYSLDKDEWIYIIEEIKFDMLEQLGLRHETDKIAIKELEILLSHIKEAFTFDSQLDEMFLRKNKN